MVRSTYCDVDEVLRSRCFGYFSEKSGVSTNFIKVSFLLDIAEGLNFMHSKDVAHCDIKPANVMVDEDINGRIFCALTDFGIARSYSDSKQAQAFKVVNLRGLSISYAAPIVLKALRNKVDATKDMASAGHVYSFAILTSFILLGKNQGNL